MDTPILKTKRCPNHGVLLSFCNMSVRDPAPNEGQIVEVRYLYCYPGTHGKLIEAKYFGRMRDDIDRTECSASQSKFKAGDSEPTES